MASDAPADGEHMIFVSMEDWDDLWRRNQFVCAEWAGRSAGRRVLFVGIGRNLLRALRRGDWRAILGNPTRAVPGHANITVTTPLRALPERFAWGRRFNEWLARRHVRRAAARLGLRAPVLWLNPHSAVHMAGRMGERALIYDITDDWEKVRQSPAEAALIRAQDAALGRRADAVIVCSEALLADKQAKFARPVHLVPNGVDADHYRAVADPALPLPEPARAWGRPVLGYTGTVHPQRVDVALVAALAARFPGGSVVLVGPDLLTDADRATLRARPNVHLVGPVPYRDIPGWMRAFDVCIVPHLVTTFTESLNPIKLWEYLAAGKPIVSTPVAGFRDYPALVRLAADADTFAAQVEAARTEDPALSAARRAEARQHSWAGRVERIERIIQACLTNPPNPP